MTVQSIPDLSQFDEQYEQAEVEETSEVPDGTYNVIVDKLELTTSKGDDKTGKAPVPMLKWTLTVVDDAKHSNRKLFRNNLIASPENLRWLKTDLTRAGLEIVKVSELESPATRERLIGAKIQVQVKTKDEYTNVYIKKRLGTESAGGGYPTGGTQPQSSQPRPAAASGLPPI